jgi:plastocyanin
MDRLRCWLSCVSLAGMLVSCTPGASSAPAGNAVAGGLIVGESLIKYGQTSSELGTVGGFNPSLVLVAQGTVIQFHNEDSFNHTASDISSAAFPNGNPIPSGAQTRSGTDVSQAGWSSGVLLPDAYSQPLTTTRTGTYLFGCFYHYPIMRGAVIVQ